MKASQYREMAEEARRMAKTVSAEEDREALLRIADGFDELADQVDRRNRLDS